jgi:hypothetical protein
LAYALIHSTTILLPAWNEILKTLKLAQRMMPRDVQTHWNSTFDTLNFAIEYRGAIDQATSDRKLDLRKYELSEEEWGYAGELCKVLRVSSALKFLCLCLVPRAHCFGSACCCALSPCPPAPLSTATERQLIHFCALVFTLGLQGRYSILFA